MLLVVTQFRLNIRQLGIELISLSLSGRDKRRIAHVGLMVLAASPSNTTTNWEGGGNAPGHEKGTGRSTRVRGKRRRNPHHSMARPCLKGMSINLLWSDCGRLRKWLTADYNTGSVVSSRKSFLRFFSWTRKIANAKMLVCYVLNYCL